MYTTTVQESIDLVEMVPNIVINIVDRDSAREYAWLNLSDRDAIA